MSDEYNNMLPIANIGRIMKQVLPPNAKISKETKERMQECASEFISFVTGEASAKCNKENRKTVNGDDVCWALSSLGFDNYSEAMLRYLNRFREFERQKDRANTSQCNKGFSSSEEKDEATNCTSKWPSYDFGFLDKGGSSSSKPS